MKGMIAAMVVGIEPDSTTALVYDVNDREE